VETNDTLAIVAAVVAVGGAAFAALPWIKGALNAHAFATIVVKLANAGNVERVVKLCRAVPDAPFAAATAVAIEALHGAPDDAAEATAMLRDRFRGSVRAWIDRASNRWIYIAIAAGGAAGACLLPRPSVLPVTAAIAGLAVIVLAYMWLQARKLAHDAVEQGDAVVAALVASRALTSN
jgi:hypothetical protein